MIEQYEVKILVCNLLQINPEERINYYQIK